MRNKEYGRGLNLLSSIEIDKIHDKLLQIYKVRYTNPKEVLYYQISELVRAGKTREEAIITLHEKEGKLTPEEAKKPREGIIGKKPKELTSVSEKVLGTIRASRSDLIENIFEGLFVTSDRVIVARIAGGGLRRFLLGAIIDTPVSQYEAFRKTHARPLEISPESVLKADKRNYAISNSEITKVELKKKLGSIRIHVETKDKKSKWLAMGILEKEKAKEKAKIEDYENILRPVFGDKLSVKK